MAEAISPQSVIASPSRRADGSVVEQGATLVGDRDSLVEHAVSQLVTQAAATGSARDAGAIRAQAEKEVDAMLAPAAAPASAPVVSATAPEPVPEAPVPAAPKPAPAPVVTTDPAAGDA